MLKRLLLTIPFCAAIAFPAAAQTQITFGTNWLPQTEHCGFYQAQESGLYKAAKLDVKIVPGGPDINVPLMVASGRYQLGMGSSFTTLNLLAEKIPGKTVAAFFQKDPQTIVVHSGQGVEKLQDLLKKPIMIARFSQQEFWQFLKAEHGFIDEQVQPYTYSAAPFLADVKAAQQGYITEDGYLLGAQMKQPPLSLLLADYGYQNYATTVFGRGDWIEKNRDAVAAFLKATAEGYRACIDGKAKEAKAAILAANPDHSEGLYDFKLAQMQKLNMVTGDEGFPIGVLSPKRVDSFFATMSKAGVYAADLPYRDAFDFTFFPAE